MAGHVARLGERRNVYRNMAGKPDEKSPFGRPKRCLENNIKMDLQEVCWGYGLDWSDSG